MTESSNADGLHSLIRDAIVPDAAQIADAFYEGMTRDAEAAVFLETELVNRRLRESMTRWITDLFAYRLGDDHSPYRERQVQIGFVHARINVPMHLVAAGMSILKRECCRRLGERIEDPKTLLAAAVHVNERLDEALVWINESYFKSVIHNERTDQSLRFHITSHNLAIECERLRSELFDWMRRRLVWLYKQHEPNPNTQGVTQSEVGLWVIHKGQLLFADTAPLQRQLELIDERLRKAAAERAGGITEDFTVAVAELDEAVTNAAWMLSSLVEQALEADRARDPLTHVLSRRYLATIMQREVRLSLQSKERFAVALIDVDDFKQINDSLGHAAGDAVLEGLGDILLHVVRANDFVFRYGGEEFLLLLSSVTERSATRVAEKVRTAIAEHRFALPGAEDYQVTVSIGLALHDGHPDYSEVIERADAALYQAKIAGRNRCVVSSGR